MTVTDKMTFKVIKVNYVTMTMTVTVTVALAVTDGYDPCHVLTRLLRLRLLLWL